MDDLERALDDNLSVGISLYTQKDAAVVRYSVLHNNEQLFASRCKLVLPLRKSLGPSWNASGNGYRLLREMLVMQRRLTWTLNPDERAA